MPVQAKPFVISRTFNAPRDLVWKAWTEQERLAQWFGPKGMERFFGALDFRVGGTFHYGLKMPNGEAFYGLWKFLEITPTTKLKLESGFADKDKNYVRHPMAPVWPLRNLSTTTFDEKDGKTTVTVSWEPLNATDEEVKLFNDSHASMTGGWGGTFDLLEEYLFNNQ
jgi:uncharacterized protein YndB with AHSA1/START domain